MFPQYLLTVSLFVIGTWAIEELEEILPADTDEFQEIIPENSKTIDSIKHAGDSVSGIADRQLILHLIDTVQSLTQQNNAQLAMMNDMKSALQQQEQNMLKMEARLNKYEQALDNVDEPPQSTYNENKRKLAISLFMLN